MGTNFSMSTAFSMTRRSLLIGGLAGLCSACGDSPLATLPTLARGLISKGANVPFTQAQIEKIPYATIAARIGGGNQALLLLRRYAGRDLVWASSDGKVIVTRRGRIVQTYGFRQDLSATMPYGVDPVSDLANLASGEIYKRAVDIQPGDHFGVLVTSEFFRVGPAPIDILGMPHRTTLWRERGHAPMLDWQFTNVYWADDATGYIWKSTQQPVPELEHFEIEVFRPARHV
jgi:Group 4 capsule polysaccharide lipoprotein gfcB, YjbF